MKNIIFFLSILLCFLLTGCLQIKEHLVIEKDGTGSLEVEMIVPKGTIMLIDKMFGSMIQGMMQGMMQFAENIVGTTEKEKIKIPESIAEEMFGNKNSIIDKAIKNGVNVEFEYFKKEKTSKEALLVFFSLLLFSLFQCILFV